MCVVPERAVLLLRDLEFVGKRVRGPYGALRHANDAVHLVGF